MKDVVRMWEVVSFRSEDTFPEAPEKKTFEKHMVVYFERIRRCNVYWSTLSALKKNKREYQIAGEYAPAFWTNVRYAMQMGLITEIVAFLGKDDESLQNYFPKILSSKDKIFTRKFYHTLRDSQTGEEREEECHNTYSNEEAFKICQQKLEECLANLPTLKAARDKVYCHLDKKALSIADCNRDIFNHINDDLICGILKNIGYIIQTLNALYDNVCHAVEYSNQDDVCGIFRICEVYSEWLPKIQEIQKQEFQEELRRLHNGDNK